MKQSNRIRVTLGLIFVVVVAAFLYYAGQEKLAIPAQDRNVRPTEGAGLQAVKAELPGSEVADKSAESTGDDGEVDAVHQETRHDASDANHARSKPESSQGHEAPEVERAIAELLEELEEDEAPDGVKRAIAELFRAGVRVKFSCLDEQEEQGDGAPERRCLFVMFATSTDRVETHGFADRSTVEVFGDLLKSLPNVTDISLRGTNVRDEHLEKLPFLPRLSGLSLQRTPITDKGLVSLAALTELTSLSLDEDTQITDTGVANLAGLTKLESLGLAETAVTDAGMAHLVAMTRLYSLNLAGTKTTDAGLKNLRQMADLGGLLLSRTAISDAGLVHLRELPLHDLWLNGTRVTDAGLVHLREGMAWLRHLDLMDTHVTKAGVDQLRRDVPSLQDQESGNTTHLGIRVGSTIADNPQTIEPATPDQISLAKQTLWWLPVRSDCVFVSHGPFAQFFGRPTAGEDGAFEEESTITLFNYLMRPPFVISDELEQVPLSLVVKASAGLKLCHVCVFERPLGDDGDAFVASLAARGARDETIGETKVMAAETDLLTGTPRTTLVARPRPDVLVLANDRDYLEEVLERMATKGARRALPDDLAEWKHLDISVRQWVLRHSPNPESPFVGLVYSLQPGDVAKLLCFCRHEVSVDFVRQWWPTVEDPHITGQHQEVRKLDLDLIEISFSVAKRRALEEFLGKLFGTFGQFWQEQAAGPEGAAPQDGDKARRNDE